MAVRVLGKGDVQSLLSMPECIDAVRCGLIALARGKAGVPLRRIELLPYHDAMLGMMPGWLSDPPCFGMKASSVYPHNFDDGLPSHQGVILIFEPAHGTLIGIVDGGAVTAIRTAAASAVATDALARPESSRLAILGYGEQARSHLQAMIAVRPISGVRVWGRDPDRAAGFASEASAASGLDVRAASNVPDCVANADIICTVTAAPDPILLGRHVANGAHVNAVGSSRAVEAEIDDELVARARMFADYKPGVLAQGAEFLRAKRNGVVDDDHILGNVGDVLVSLLPGRLSAGEVTLFKSLGIVVEDLAAASHVLQRAIREGYGATVEM